MTRKEVRKFWKIIKAFKNGAKVEIKIHGRWIEDNDPLFTTGAVYRVKKESTPNQEKTILISNDKERWQICISTSNDSSIRYFKSSKP